MEENAIASLVRKQETDYNSGDTTISKYVNFSLKDTIETIEAYLNSKHTSGSTDSKGRDKPFFNLVRPAVNVWYRATDIDRKDIVIKPTKEADIIGAFFASAKLQEWMKKENFGKFLNDWGITLARYGSAVVKFTEQDSRLIPQVIPWNRLIVDSVDINNAPVIEKFYMTPAQLLQYKGYDQEVVQELIKTKKARETTGKDKKDSKADFIEIYEVHGELPLSYLTGEEKDENIFVQQMHAISYLSKGKGKKGYDDFCLYKGKEAENPYMLTHLIKEDGRTLSIGAVENLFEAQWMTNHTMKGIKDQLDLASKLVFQTSDASFLGNNFIDAIDTGDILVHSENKPLTQVANNSHDISSLQSFGQQWKQQGNEVNGLNDSLLGNNPPSGTAWRQTEALLQESHSLFEIMKQNKGLDIEQMLRLKVIPFLKKSFNSKEEIVVFLKDFNISQIEERYIKNRGIKNRNMFITDKILNNGEIPEDIPVEEFQNKVREGLMSQGEYRFLSPDEEGLISWKDVFKDLEWEVDVTVTNESSNKQVALTSLNTLFTTLIRLGNQPMTPDQKLVFNQIMTEIGTVSPLQFSNQNNQPVAVPSGGQVGASGLSNDLGKLTKSEK